MAKTSHHAGTKSGEIQLLHVKLGTVSRIMLDCTGESYSKKDCICPLQPHVLFFSMEMCKFHQKPFKNYLHKELD